MENGYRLIDSDAHIIEPAVMFEKYLEPEFRSPLPVAWSEYSGEPLAFRFKLVILGAGGEEYSMPFGRDPLNDEQRARFGGFTFDLGEPLVLPRHEQAYLGFALKGFAPKLSRKRWNGPVSTIWSSIRALGY
jgi:hypothetical protein